MTFILLSFYTFLKITPSFLSTIKKENIKARKPLISLALSMVHLTEFEPATVEFEVHHSIQLSYRCIIFSLYKKITKYRGVYIWISCLSIINIPSYI